MGEYKHREFTARMTYYTWCKLRRHFKPLNRSESARNYFLRLAKYLEAESKLDFKWPKREMDL